VNDKQSFRKVLLESTLASAQTARNVRYTNENANSTYSLQLRTVDIDDNLIAAEKAADRVLQDVQSALACVAGVSRLRIDELTL
jgi:hypothetical protein